VASKRALFAALAVALGVLGSGCYAAVRPAGYYTVAPQPVYVSGYYSRPAYYNGGGVVYGQPTYAQPVYARPTYAQPVYAQPVYQRPAVQVQAAPRYYSGGGVVNTVRAGGGGGRAGAVEVRGR